MPLPAGVGVGTGVGFCALTQIAVNKNRIRTPVNLLVSDIDLKTFQQGTFGPGEMLKIRVAEETPEAKNCGVSVKTASKIQPSLCWRLELLFFESSGPLRTTVAPDKLPNDDWYPTRPLLPTVAVRAGSLSKGERMM